MQASIECSYPLTPDNYPICQVLHAMELTARAHMTAMGIPRAYMLSRYGAVWMIVRGLVRLTAPLDASAPLSVRSWHRGLTRGVIYRDFDLLQNGRPIGEAVQTWVLTDAVKRSLYRMEQVPELGALPRPETVKTLRPGKPQPPAPLQPAAPLWAGMDALDENGHINNVAYVLLALSTLNAPQAVSSVELSYHRECFVGQPLPRLCCQTPDAAFVRLLTPTGEPAFDLLARTEVLPI